MPRRRDRVPMIAIVTHPRTGERASPRLARELFFIYVYCMGLVSECAQLYIYSRKYRYGRMILVLCLIFAPGGGGSIPTRGRMCRGEEES